MSPQTRERYQRNRRFPRVSGDEPTFFAIEAPQAKFSPRERG